MNATTIRRFVLLVFVLVMSTGEVRADSLLVFSASSLTDAMSEAADTFSEATGTEVVLSFAASSVLAKQIEHGAPAGVYVSANPDWMAYLEDRELVVADGDHTIAQNRLVVIAPADSDAAIDVDDPASLVRALGARGRLAIGDPTHVPAGQYARQALEHLGVWTELSERLAPAANVRGAVALVERGEAPLGIVYRTDAAVTDRVRVIAELPSESHDRIKYPAARIVLGDNTAAQAFVDFLLSEEGRDIFVAHGFIPGFDEACGCTR